jgi:hypothetical protein
MDFLPAVPDVLPREERQDNEDDNQQHKPQVNHGANHICSPFTDAVGPPSYHTVLKKGGNSALLQPQRMASGASWRIPRDFWGQIPWLGSSQILGRICGEGLGKFTASE